MLMAVDDIPQPRSPSAQANPLLRWLVVRCYSGSEWQLHCALLQRGIESLFPHRVYSARHGRWSKGFLQPLFPGYLFAGLEPGQDTDDIKHVSGTIDVLRVNGMPIHLAPGEIAGIRRQAERAYVESLGVKAKTLRVEIGDWVPAPEGHFQGVPVRVVAIDKHNRITASLGNVTVTFPLSALAEPVYAVVNRYG